jgi:hypothetical protein
MEHVVFGRWRLSCDCEASRRGYQLVPVGAPEACGCLYCRNFAATRSHVYPAEVLALFEQLGIDPSREAEVYHMGPLQPGLHRYGGWFHFVGRIEAEGESVGKFDLEGSPGPFKFYFAENRALAPKSFEGLPLVQLDFEADVPWVIEEPEEE